jgi:hypothetical protein
VQKTYGAYAGHSILLASMSLLCVVCGDIVFRRMMDHHCLDVFKSHSIFVEMIAVLSQPCVGSRLTFLGLHIEI